MIGGPGLAVGAAGAVALRRHPAMGVALGVALAWLIDGWTQGWTVRAGGVVAALGGLVLSRVLPRAAWWLAGGVGGILTVAQLSWPLSEKLLWGGLVALAMVGGSEALRRAPARGVWGVVGMATATGIGLTALTGSVRVAAESARLLLPVVGMAGCTASPRTRSLLGALVAATCLQGVVWSSLGAWVLVPFACLGASRLGTHPDRPRWVPGLAAGLVGAGGALPVVVDWIREPPF